MAKEEKKVKKGPEFRGSFGYVAREIPGTRLYRREKEESIDEMLEKLDKQDIDSIKKEELKSRIRTRAAEAEQKRLELQGKGKVEPKERRFSIIDNKPVLDPEGDYTFSEAIRTCAIAAGEKTGVSGDKVSDILNSIQPFIQESRGAAKETEEKRQETSLAVTAFQSAIDALKERGTGQQPMTLNDMIGLFEKLDQLSAARTQGQADAQPSVLDQLAQLGSTFKTLQDVFGGGSKGESPIMVQLPGTDGKGGMPLDAFMKWDEHRWDRHKDEIKFEDNRETGKALREFVGLLGKAAGRLGPKEE